MVNLLIFGSIWLITLLGMVTTFLLGAMLLASAIRGAAAGKQVDLSKLKVALASYSLFLATGIFALGGSTAAACSGAAAWKIWGLAACAAAWAGVGACRAASRKARKAKSFIEIGPETPQ